MDGGGDVPNKAPLMPPRNIRRPGYEAYLPATADEVSLDEMLSLACRQGKQDIVELLLESGANVNHRNKAGNTPLLEACSQGHVDAARMLLDRGADIDTPTETTLDSALTWACTLGNERVVDLLLTQNTNVEHRTKDGCTALMFASLAGHVEVARMLLDHNAEINVESDSNKDSPLTFACWKGHQDVVELLLERKADIEHRTKEGFTPLMFAALGGHKEVAHSLLKHGALVNTPSGSNNDIPLTSACWKGHCCVVQLLLEYHSDIEHHTKDGCTPLMLAAREGHLDVAKLLLENQAEVNIPSGSESNIPLTLACWKGHKDVVELLLNHGSDPEHRNKAGCTPLMLAAREGHFDATKLLLNHGVECNMPSGSNDDTPLTLACWKGHSDIVSLLIEQDSNLNHQTKTGCTPLMEATREGYVEVAKILLEAGSDVETPDNYGQSPLFMACWKGHADVAELLLQHNANKDCRTKTGITPLFQACRENNVEVVKLLIDYGCNVNIPFPNSRECPLTLCAERGYFELISLLLERGCNADCRTKRGCTPFFLACKEGHQKVSQLLLEHSADPEAAEAKNITPLVATFKNGHFEVVEWLLKYTNRLPSDAECQKCLLAPAPDDLDEATRSDLLHNRSKCLELILKAKKTKEEAAQMNAQILCAELDAEKEKRETKKNKKKEKRKRKHEKKMAQALSGSEGLKETDNGVLLSSKSSAKGDIKFCHLEGNVDEVALLTSLSSLAETDGSDILEKKEHTRAEAESSCSSSSSTRSSTQCSDIASQPDEDEEEIFEDASSVLADDQDEFHSCYNTMPLSVKTFANSTLLQDTQVSETPFKRHDRPAVSSAINSQSSSRTSSNSSDTTFTAMNGFGSVKRKGSKNKGNFLTKGDKKTSERSSLKHQRNDPNSTSRSSAPSVLDTIKCTVETSLSPSTSVIQTSAMATNTKSTMSTLSSSGKQAWMHGRNLISSGGVTGIASRQPQAADMPDCSSISSNVTSSTVPSSHALHKRRTSAPAFSSRMVSTGVNYAASVKANLPSSTTTTTAVTQRPSSPLSVTTLHNASPSVSTISTSTTNTTSTSTLDNDNTYVSHALASGGKPLQDVSGDCNNSTGPQNLVAASDSINLILQDLDSAAAVRNAAARKEKQPAEAEVSTNHSCTEVADNPNDVDVLEQEWDNNNLFPLSSESNTGDDKISCLQEDASAGLGPGDNAESSTATITTGPAIVQGVKMLNMSVTDSLVGRVIGLGGNKINSITRESGAQITVSSRQPRPSENRIITIRGTQKSIDKARELIDEVLSRPDKEYEAAKHQLGHSSSHYQQQNRSYEMGGGNYQQGPAWSSGGSKRHSTCVPPQRGQMIVSGTGGMPIPTKRTSLPATMKPSAAQLEVPVHHYSRSPSPSSIMNRVSPNSISPRRLSPVDPNTMMSGNNVMLNVNNAEFTHDETLGVLNANGTMYGSSGSLHKTPSPNSLSPRKMSPSGYSSTPPHDLVHLSISPAQRKYSPTVPMIFSPDDMLGCSSDGSSSVTLIRSKSVSPQPGFPVAVEQFTEERNAYNLQYQRDPSMSQDSMEKMGNVREGQFGAIGTRREQRSVSATQLLSSSSTAGPDVNMFTVTTNNNTNTVVQTSSNANPGRRRMSYAGLNVNQQQEANNTTGKTGGIRQSIQEDSSSTGGDSVDPKSSQDWPSRLPDASWKQQNPNNAVPAQWLSSIAEDPKSRSFSWAGQPGAQFQVFGSMLHPQHHQQMNLPRAQSEEFITPFPPLWQDRGITPLPPTPNGIILPACPSPAQPFVAPSPLPQYDHMPLQYDPRGFYMQNLPNAMFRPIETQTRASSGSIPDSQEAANLSEGYNKSSNEHLPPQQLIQQQQQAVIGQGVYAMQGMFHAKQPPFQMAQPGNHLMLPQQRSQLSASSAPTSPRLQHHGLNPIAMSMNSSEDQQLLSSRKVDKPMNKRWSVPSMIPGSHSPIPPFNMQHVHMNASIPAAKHVYKSDNSAYTKANHQDSWVNHETSSTLNSGVVTTTTGSHKSVPFADYKTAHHTSGSNPWANPLMEETEDQALVPDTTPNVCLIDLIKGLGIADQHIESLQQRNLTIQELQMMKPDDWKRLDIPMGPRLKLMNAVSNASTGHGQKVSFSSSVHSEAASAAKDM